MDTITVNHFSKACSAKNLSITQRKEIAIEALNGSSSVSSLARENKVYGVPQTLESNLAKLRESL